MSDDFVLTQEHADPGRSVVIQVNAKPVTVFGPRLTGRGIKEAALGSEPEVASIALLVRDRGGHSEMVGDDQEIDVGDNDVFMTIMPDAHGGATTGPIGAIDDRRDVVIFVNEKKIEVSGPIQTGMSIKAAAIKAGVDIKPDFILLRELEGGKTEKIGDDQKIRVRERDRFVAIADDDNS